MRLDVGLADHVEAQLVAEVQEGRIVRVVRGPHGVEPEALHLDQVCPHVVARDHPSRVPVEVVPVHATDEDAPAIDEQVQPADLHPSEPDLQNELLDDLAAWRAERDREGVEDRHLRRPRSDRGDVGAQDDLADVCRREIGVETRPEIGALRRGEGHSRDRPVGELAAVAAGTGSLEAAGVGHSAREGPGEVREPRFHRPARLGSNAREGDLRADLERAVDQVVGEARDGPDIGEVHPLRCVEEDRPSDAAVPPLVLVLDVAGVGPLDDGQRDRVVRVLADPHLAPVDAGDEDALGRADVEDDPATRPAGRHLDLPLVLPGGVRVRDVRRQTREGHHDIRVVGQVAPALHRPAARDVDLAPGARRLCIGSREQLEAPPAVQVHAIGVGHAVHRHATDAGELGRLPGRRAAGARDRHPFVEPRVSPLMNCFWRAKKTISVGSATMIDPAARRL